jgi:ferritin
MLNERMQQAINEQINAELYSAYLYASMAAYYTSVNLSGFANWMRIQVQEEMLHAQFMYDFINERGGRVTLFPIAGPPAEWPDPSQPFKDAYAHELDVTRRINDLMNLAHELRDHASASFFQWFVNEQVEEEANADKVVKQLQLTGNAGSGLFMIDRELAARVFTPPTVLPAGVGG